MAEERQDDEQRNEEHEVIDGTASEEGPGDSSGAQLVHHAPPSAAVATTEPVTAADLSKRMALIKEAMQAEMVEGTDYGKVPGTNKPTLLKPGAEKLGVLFRLNIQLENEKHFDGDHLTVMSRATVYDAGGHQVGFGEGLCTSKEKKYGKRRKKRLCPECGEDTVRKSKFPPHFEKDGEPGWWCPDRDGGCGEEFAAAAPRVVDQVEEEITNPDLPDTWNTIVKMAEKRARVDAVLAVTGASALFTQDVEDMQGGGDGAGQRRGEVIAGGRAAAGAPQGPRRAGVGPDQDLVRRRAVRAGRRGS